MKIKRIIAAVLSLCMVGGAFTFNAPTVRDYSITADAAGECYIFNSTTGLLTLKGNVVLDEITGFEQKDAVKTIKAAEGTVFPESCKLMFHEYLQCTSIDLSNVDTSNVTDMSNMFNIGNASELSPLTYLDISSFDTSNVTDMSLMFRSCELLTSLDLSSFDTSNVTDMYGMFAFCLSLTSLDLSSFDTSNVTDMYGMFSRCESLPSLDLSSFDTSNVTNMSHMFSCCESLPSLDLSTFDTSNVADMSSMFYNCSGSSAIDLSSFNTSNVQSMYSMFEGCSGLIALDLSSFNTSNVTDMSYMFYDCPSLTTLDLSSFDTSNVESADLMFRYCTDLSVLTLGKNFGDIAVGHELPNRNGWVNASAPSTVISGSAEFAEFNNTGGTYIKYGIDKKGDVNCDGEIAIADAVLLQKWLLAVPDAQIPYWKNADLCEDDRLDVFDLCLLKQLMIEQNETYTIRLEKVGEDITSLTSAISIINKYLGCGLKEAKNIVNAAPVTITDSATRADADQLVADLELVGATVTVTKN